MIKIIKIIPFICILYNNRIMFQLKNKENLSLNKWDSVTNVMKKINE